MLLGEHSVRTGKNTSAQKHMHHKHTTMPQGSNPAPASSHPVPQPLFRRWSQTRLSGWRFKAATEAEGWGEGGMCVCVLVVYNQCL